MKSLWIKFKKNWQLITAFFITYLIPIAMLSEIMAFTKEVKPAIKVTFMGCIALGALFLVFYKKLKEYVIRLPKGLKRGILKIINTVIFWSIMFGIVVGLQYIGGLLQDYWIKVGVCFAIGHIFYMWDEIKKREEKPIENEEEE